MNESKKLRGMPKEPDERLLKAIEKEARKTGEEVRAETEEEFMQYIDFFLEKVQNALSSSEDPRSFIEAGIRNLAAQKGNVAMEDQRNEIIRIGLRERYGINIVLYLTKDGRDRCIEMSPDISKDDFEEFNNGIYKLRLPKGSYNLGSGWDPINITSNFEARHKDRPYFKLADHNVIRMEAEQDIRDWPGPFFWQNSGYNWQGEIVNSEMIETQRAIFEEREESEKKPIRGVLPVYVK